MSEPVDREDIATLHGTPVDELRRQQAAQPTGQYADYIVLSDAERAKGFVRPVRDNYIPREMRLQDNDGPQAL